MAGAAALLGGTPLLAAASPAELEQLAAGSFRRQLARGQVLFSAGEPCEHLYVVESGQLKVEVTSEHGEELILATVGPGECLGELGVVDGAARSATVVALTAAVLLAVPAPAVRDLLARSPAVTLELAVALAGSLRRLTGSTADLVFLDLPRRLAKLLLGLTGPGGREVDLGMSQGEVAARLGVTRQSLNRALALLQRRGWIRLAGPRVRLVDTRSLERFVAS